MRHANYGIDAPHVVRNLALAGLVGLGLGAASLLVSSLPRSLLIPMRMMLWPGASMGLTATGMVLGSKVFKLRARDRLLDTVSWRGDERVLDVGCGRGLLVIGAARRLTTGRAIGIDLWQGADLTGNSRDAVIENARMEGVSDRVEIQNGDARQLPFPDASFDVVLSMSCLHNIPDPQGRAAAIREVCRVLKPDGRLAMYDILYTADYVDQLRTSGTRDVQRSGPNFMFVIPSRRVTAVRSRES